MTELTKTREQLITLALDNLQVSETGQDPSDDDYDKVDERLDGLLESLRIKEICSITDDDQIPVEYVDDLALLLADRVALTFGRQQSGDAAVRLIEDRLQVLSRRRDASNRRLTVDPMLRSRGGFTYSRWSSGR